MIRGKGLCALNFKELGIDWQILKKILKIGIPAGIEDSLFSFSNVLIQSSINSFGAVAMAGNTAAKSIDHYLSVFTATYSQSAITAVSQNNGAKDYKRLKKSIFVCAAMTAVTMLVVGVIMFTFGRPLLSLFVKDNPEVIEWGLVRLRIMASTYLIAGLMSMGSSVLRGLGKSLTSTIIALVGTCALRVVWTYTMFVWFRSFAMVFYVYPVTWVVTGTITYIMIYLTLKKIIRAHKAELQAELEEAEKEAQEELTSARA
jgi:Na+-driven multidrug efflux pump